MNFIGSFKAFGRFPTKGSGLGPGGVWALKEWIRNNSYRTRNTKPRIKARHTELASKLFREVHMVTDSLQDTRVKLPACFIKPQRKRGRRPGTKQERVWQAYSCLWISINIQHIWTEQLFRTKSAYICFKLIKVQLMIEAFCQWNTDTINEQLCCLILPWIMTWCKRCVRVKNTVSKWKQRWSMTAFQEYWQNTQAMKIHNRHKK